MKRPLGYGIDFGTTNSSISIGYDDGSVRVVPIGDRLVQPDSHRSLVYIDRQDQRTSGREAVQNFGITGAHVTRCDHCPLVVTSADGIQYSNCNSFRSGSRCSDSRLLAGLKSELANPYFRSTHSWATDFELEELIAIVFRELKRRADIESGEDVRRAVLGYPVSFVGADGKGSRGQEFARERLVRSAEIAGFDDILLMPEPAAAVAHEELADGYVVSVDFGGGTFDVAVIEVVAGESTLIELDGVAVGGTNFDAALFDLTVAESTGLYDEIGGERFVHRYPAAIKSGMRTLAGTRLLINDPQIPFTLAKLESAGIDTDPVRAILQGGLAFDFYGSIEQAKIDLTVEDESQIYFVRPGVLAVIEDVDRESFDEATRQLLESVEDSILRVLRDGEIEPGQVHTVIRTGGSSMIPAFVERLGRLFPSSDLLARPAFTSVAEGLGSVAAQEFTHD